MRSKGVGGVRARQASPRALAIAGGVVLAIVIAIVLGVVLSGGSGGGGGVVSSSDLKDLPATGSQTWAGSLPGAAEAIKEKPYLTLLADGRYPDLALHFDGPAQSSHDTVHDRQPEAGALVGTFCREERLE